MFNEPGICFEVHETALVAKLKSEPWFVKENRAVRLDVNDVHQAPELAVRHILFEMVQASPVSFGGVEDPFPRIRADAGIQQTPVDEEVFVAPPVIATPVLYFPFVLLNAVRVVARLVCLFFPERELGPNQEGILVLPCVGWGKVIRVRVYAAPFLHFLVSPHRDMVGRTLWIRFFPQEITKCPLGVLVWASMQGFL